MGREKIKLKPLNQKPGMCGISSIKMVLDYWGTVITEDELAKIAGASKENGTSKEGFIKIAQHFGFDILVKENSSLADIRFYIKKEIPVIVNWFLKDDGHYSVAVDIDRSNISLADPALRKPLISANIRKMSCDKFQRLWFDFPGDYMKGREDLILRLMIVITPKEPTEAEQ